MNNSMNEFETLIAQSPYLHAHAGKIIVIKYGGNALSEDDSGAMRFAEDIALLVRHGVKPVIVHGGGPQIDQMLARLSITSEFVRGLRVTSAAAIEVIEMVLCGKVNPEIVSALGQSGVTSIGLSGKDGNLIPCKPLRTEGTDYGFVGEIQTVNADILQKLLAADIIPVIAPIGIGARGESYNINADTAAGAIAGALAADRFLLLTNVAGVLDDAKKLIPELTPTTAHAMIAGGTIVGGMIPKVETCLQAVSGGARGAVIMDGRVAHAILLELFTDEGSGTLVRAAAINS